MDSETGITAYTTSDLTDRKVQYREVGSEYEALLTYTYNRHNLITKIEENIDGNKRNTLISYDDDNRVATWRKGSGRLYYTYDPYSRISETQTYHVPSESEVMTETFTYYSPGDNLTSTLVSDYRTQTVGDYDVTYTYTYDDNGNILSVYDGTYRTRYVYDTANQLIRENNRAAEKTWVWEYDDAGNILSRKEYAYTLNGLSGVTPIDTVTYTYGSSTLGDVLTHYDGQRIYRDDICNPETDGTWTYTWKHGRELATMSDGTTTWTYTYNADGLRTRRATGDGSSDDHVIYDYVYLDGQLVKMTVDGNTMYFAYDADGTPLSVLSNGTTYYYVTNLQGDVVGLVTSAGRLVVSYTYDAWGKLLTVTGEYAGGLGNRNPLRYRGYVYDRETGLYYLQSRYYNPEMGRFINADAFAATGQGLLGNNMFAYCNNNPIVHGDPAGEMATWVISGLIGTVTSVSCAYIGGERGAELIDDMFWGFLGGSVGVVGKIGALVDAIETGIDFGQSSGSALGGIVVGTMSYGVSLFTGSNVSKLNGVLPMDEAAELFFDATFGYAANVFNTLTVDNLETVFRVPASTSNTTQVSRQNSSRRKAANSTYYQNKTANLLGIS